MAAKFSSTAIFSTLLKIAFIFLTDWQEKWCGRWELNPHGPCGPADFLTGYGFRRPDNAGLRSGLSLHLAPRHYSATREVRRCPSSLYTFLKYFFRLGSGS